MLAAVAEHCYFVMKIILHFDDLKGGMMIMIALKHRIRIDICSAVNDFEVNQCVTVLKVSGWLEVQSGFMKMDLWKNGE